MRSLIWTLRFAVFVLLLGFAIKNSDGVTLKFFFGTAWQMPLVFIMLIFFILGAALGVSAALASRFKLRREVGKLRHELASRQETAVKPPVLPI